MKNPNFMGENAFVNGLYNCRGKDAALIKQEIMHSLSLRNDKAYYNRKYGFIRHTPYERQGIEHTFGRYGVKPSEVWGFAGNIRPAQPAAQPTPSATPGTPATTPADSQPTPSASPATSSATPATTLPADSQPTPSASPATPATIE